MNYQKIILFFLVCCPNVFGGDSKGSDDSEGEAKIVASSYSSDGPGSPKPKLGLLISSDDLARCVHKHFEGCPGTDVSKIIDSIAGQSMVFLDDLLPGIYREPRTRRRYPYWSKPKTGIAYGVEDSNVLENGVGFDSDKVRSLLEEVEGEGSRPSFDRYKDNRYNDKSRHILKKCKHAFHAGCLEQLILFKPECPVCRTPVKQKDSKHEYLYKADEKCTICCYPIVPSPVVVPAGSRFAGAGTSSGGGGSAGAGGPSTVVAKPSRSSRAPHS